MSINILNQVSAELEELQGQLKQFKTSVEYLNSAKGNVSDAVQAIRQAENYHFQKLKEIEVVYNTFSSVINGVQQLSAKIESVNFPERLSSIDTSVAKIIAEINESTKTTLQELKTASQEIANADFGGRFLKLDGLINTTMDANKSHLEEAIQKAKENTEKFKGSIREMGTEIDAKFKEQNNNLNSLNIPQRFDKLGSAIESMLSIVQNRFDILERNIFDKLKDIAALQKVAQVAIQESLTTSAKKQRTLTYITWGLIVITILAFFLQKLI